MMAELNIGYGISSVLRRIDEAYLRRSKMLCGPKPELIAVSKTKTTDQIIEAYSVGQRSFGENYVQELKEKCQHPKILEICTDIKWHFIGHLQTNKVNTILNLPRIYMIQTVDSKKLANALNSSWGKIELKDKKPLKVLLQVNTSGEEAKYGVKPEDTADMFKYIREELNNLQIVGLMTIGAEGHGDVEPNPDFVKLMNLQREICQENNLTPNDVHVSMGMSNDFEKAIELGSSIVRVGSAIFGHRIKK